MNKFFIFMILLFFVSSINLFGQGNWSEIWDYDDGVIFQAGFPRNEVILNDNWDIASWTQLDRDIGWGIVSSRIQVVGTQFWHPCAMTLEDYEWTDFEYQATVRVLEVEKPENIYKGRIHLFFKVNKGQQLYYDFNFRGKDPNTMKPICTLYRSIYGEKYTRAFAHAGPDPDPVDQPDWSGNFGDSTYVLKVHCVNDSMQFWVNDELINWDREDTTDTDVVFKTGTTIYVGDPADESIYVGSGSIGFRTMKWRAWYDNLYVTEIVPSAVEDEDRYGVLPEEYVLLQNYPNPFNPSTEIAYNLPVQSDVTLSIYNTLGQIVRTLVSGKQPAGYHQVTWNGLDDAGIVAQSGLYFYTLRAGGVNFTKKMLLVK